MENDINLKNLKILFVEDDHVARGQMLELLEIMFGEVIIAQDGQVGYEMFALNHNQGDNAIDIILSDINMPNLNGIEMVKKVRELDPTIPVIFLSAHNEEDYLIQAIKLHVSDYIFKPMRPNELMQSFKRSYLPIHQQKMILSQNQELKIINEKIKKRAKEEFELIQSDLNLQSEDDVIDIAAILDSISAND